MRSLLALKQWMIHEISPHDLKIIENRIDPCENILIFDDGVLSQYQLLGKLKKFHKFLAVSPVIAESASNKYKHIQKRQIYIEPTSAAHERWHYFNDSSGFMCWNMIRQLQMDGVHIVLHGYRHDRLTTDYKKFNNELQLSIDLFELNLGFKPEIFVYPYNESNTITDAIVRSHNMIPIGPGRIDYRTLLNAGGLE